MTTSRTDALPGSLRAAAWLLRGEGLGLGVVAAYLLYQDLTAATVDLASALLVTAFAAGGAALLWVLGTVLLRRRPAARAPAIVVQLLLLPAGYYMIEGGLAWLGGPLIALGLLVCGLLLSPPTTRALGLG